MVSPFRWCGEAEDARSATAQGPLNSTASRVPLAEIACQCRDSTLARTLYVVELIPRLMTFDCHEPNSEGPRYCKLCAVLSDARRINQLRGKGPQRILFWRNAPQRVQCATSISVPRKPAPSGLTKQVDGVAEAGGRRIDQGVVRDEHCYRVALVTTYPSAQEIILEVTIKERSGNFRPATLFRDAILRSERTQSARGFSSRMPRTYY